MTKTEIRAILFLHSSEQDGTFTLTEKNLNATIEDLYKGLQKALGKEVRKSSVKYANPIGVHHHVTSMNAAILEFIEARKSMGKPLTDKALQMMLKRFREGGFTVKECIEAINVAISAGHMGVFPRKSFRKTGPTDIAPKEIDYSEGLPTKKKN